MKYMLMMNAPKGTGDYAIFNWPPQDIRAHIDFMKRLNEELGEAGELVACEGLTPPGQAKRVRAGQDGQPITDGIFPETKEFLAGYWIIDVDRPERAYEVAAKVSGLLARMTDNPMVALNHAIATAMVRGPEAGLVEIDRLAGDRRIEGHHRLDAVRAHLLERAGDHEGAIAHYRKAASRTASIPERNYLVMRAARLAADRFKRSEP